MSIITVGLSQIIKLMLADNKPLQKFYNYLYNSYNPDVTGYTLLFMIPPEFSADGYANNAKLEQPNMVTKILSSSYLNIMPEKIGTLKDFAKVYPFFATDFTPPQTQVINAQVQARTGAISYASDVTETESVSVQFVESNPLTVYKFHLLWVEYIRDILRGTIEPNMKYLKSDSGGDWSTGPQDSDYYGSQDYLASFYVVKYNLDMETISYIGKCIGVFPLTLPSKDLIGNRLTNEICILPFDYSCVAYREYVEGMSSNIWIKEELETLLEDQFGSSLLSFLGI